MWLRSTGYGGTSGRGKNKSAHAPVSPTDSTTLRYGMGANMVAQYTTPVGWCNQPETSTGHAASPLSQRKPMRYAGRGRDMILRGS